MTRKEKQNCPWCPENANRCQSDEVVATCDFRTLGRSKEAVIERLISERKFLDTITNKKNIDEALALSAMDRLAGMSIMMKYLKENFKMTDEEIKKAVGFKKLGWAQKMKLVMKMKSMEKARGAK